MTDEIDPKGGEAERAAICDYLGRCAIALIDEGAQVMADGDDSGAASTHAHIALQLMQAMKRIERGDHLKVAPNA